MTAKPKAIARIYLQNADTTGASPVICELVDGPGCPIHVMHDCGKCLSAVSRRAVEGVDANEAAATLRNCERTLREAGLEVRVRIIDRKAFELPCCNDDEACDPVDSSDLPS